MRIREIPGIHPRLVEVMEQAGFDNLWPSQEEGALRAIRGESVVLSVPTASGKSLVAYLATLQRALRGERSLYIVPLRALGSEKYRELEELARPLGVQVSLSLGDFDSSDGFLDSSDIVVLTSEKADALLRRRVGWIRRASLVVADEVHLLGDPTRGPTLEVVLARLRLLNPDLQVIALSATVRNSIEIARWLGAHHVQSSWRPVPLREGVVFGRSLEFLDGETREVRSEEREPLLALVDETIREGGLVLLFVQNRRSTEATAEKIRRVVRPHLSPDEQTLLRSRMDDLSSEEKTGILEKLSCCFQDGVAFHHAGLTHEQRTIVEEGFRKGYLKVVVATTSLAAGVNLPSRRVIIRDLDRFEAGWGLEPIPVLEYKQMAGRAGRPRYDTFGEAITIAKTPEDRKRIFKDYVRALPEKVESRIGNEKELRTHILAAVASGFVSRENHLWDLLDRTFWSHERGPGALRKEASKALDFLIEEGLLVLKGEVLEATPFGRRVSDLYVDPWTAVLLRNALTSHPHEEADPVAYLHGISLSPELPMLYMSKKDEGIETEFWAFEERLLVRVGGEFDLEQLVSAMKSALVLRDWIEEVPEDRILQEYGIYPGDLRLRIETSTWLLRAFREVASLFAPTHVKPLSSLETRVRHGAKSELLPLLKFRGVGRYRARKLFNAGFRGEKELREATVEELTKVEGIGRGIALSILKELGGGRGG